MADIDVEKYRDFIDSCRSDPILAARLLLGPYGELTWYQRRTISDIWNKQFTLMVWGRAAGKTYTMALSSVLMAVLYPGIKIGLLSKTYRQASDYLFGEVSKLVRCSDFLVDSTDKGPSKSPTRTFWSTKSGSEISALPLTEDGENIRGARFNVLFIDEFAFVPENIVYQVIFPFMAIKRGTLRKKDDWGVKDSFGGNKLIMASSAYYRFNHLFKTFLEYKAMVRDGDTNHSVHEYDYRDAEMYDFYDPSIIEDARKRTPRTIFLMEWERHFPADSAGFFPRSLIDMCTSSNVIIRDKGDSQFYYVMGVDPARSYDWAAITILEIGSNSFRVCYVNAYHQMKFQWLARQIRELAIKFNVSRIGLDLGGGGYAVLDALSEDYPMIHPITGNKIIDTPLFPIDSDNKIKGKRIIETIAFRPQIVNDMNFALKASMENGGIYFPSVVSNNMSETDEVYNAVVSDVCDKIEKAKEQLSCIVTYDGGTFGNLKFDIDPPSQHKDLYSSLLVAHWAAKNFLAEGLKPQGKLAGGIWV